MKQLLPFLALPMLAACHVDTKDPVDGDENVSIDASDNGTVNFDLPFAKGEVSLPAGFMKDGNVDIDGVKLMPGSKVTGFSMMSDHGTSTVTIGYSAPKSPDEVRAYFADQFTKKGGQSTIAGNELHATTSDGSRVTISANAASGGTTGKIDIEESGPGEE